jgi:hypothetical protein
VGSRSVPNAEVTLTSTGDPHLDSLAGQEPRHAGGVDEHVVVPLVVTAPGAVIVAHEHGDLAEEAVPGGREVAARCGPPRCKRTVQRDPVTSPAAPGRRPLMANASKKQSPPLVVELTTY